MWELDVHGPVLACKRGYSGLEANKYPKCARYRTKHFRHLFESWQIGYSYSHYTDEKTKPQDCLVYDAKIYALPKGPYLFSRTLDQKLGPI